VNGAQNAIAQQLYSNEIASLNRSFAEQTASTQGFNNVQSQLANCCCENRLATANLTAVVQAENCADRAALSDGLRDIIVNQTANTQKIIDMMCQDKIDAKNEKILELQNQLNMTNLAASQFAQTQQIIAAIPTTTAPAA
jgi:chromosome condensin MukBEF ATPase and DNA-binding subunit MukB